MIKHTRQERVRRARVAGPQPGRKRTSGLTPAQPPRSPFASFASTPSPRTPRPAYRQAAQACRGEPRDAGESTEAPDSLLISLPTHPTYHVYPYLQHTQAWRLQTPATINKDADEGGLRLRGRPAAGQQHGILLPFRQPAVGVLLLPPPPRRPAPVQPYRESTAAAGGEGEEAQETEVLPACATDGGHVRPLRNVPGGEHPLGDQGPLSRRHGALLARPTNPCHVFGIESIVDAAVVGHGGASRVLSMYPY